MEVPCYQAKLLCELNEQRKRDFFCDCSILVEGRVFKAHRNVLFAGSGYFRALLVHYLQDSGQRHSTASLDIVTADAFSTILDFLYSGRLALCSANVIEVMSAASYLQMTDVVSFCKGYIRSSLEICNREKEREREERKERGGEGPADSGTPALPPSAAGVAAAAAASPGASGGASPSRGRGVGDGSGAGSSAAGGPPLPALGPQQGPAPLPAPPLAPSRGSESDCSSRGEYLSGGGGGQQGHRDHPSHPPPSSSASSGLSLILVHPKIEYDPDEDLEDCPPDAKDLPLYDADAPLHHHHHHHHHDNRLLPPSPGPAGERSSGGYGGYHVKHFMEALARGGGGGGGGSSPLRDRGGEQGPLFAQGMGFGPGGGRVDEGLGLGGSSIMEIQSDWYGEDTGDGLLVPVKLHKCPFCPYTAKQKGILKRHIRCHTGERPFPCQLCGKRFTRQEHLRSHSLSVHRSSWPVVCKGCRRTFAAGAVSNGLRRFGLCDGCTCVTTTGSAHDDSGSAHDNEPSGPAHPGDGGGDTDWTSFMDDVDEAEMGGARGGEGEELEEEKTAGVLHRQNAQQSAAAGMM